MTLPTFLAAVHAASKTYAPEYGLRPEELELTLLAAAGVEGGLGPEANIGDSGHSVGRFQFNFAGGHGATLRNQGHSDAEIADDQFQAMHWAPIIAAELSKAKHQGLAGASAMQAAVFAAERPAQNYDPAKFFNAIGHGASLAGLDPQTLGITGAAAPGGANMPGQEAATKYWENRGKVTQLNAQFGMWFEKGPQGGILGDELGFKRPDPATLQAALQQIGQLNGEIADYEQAYKLGGGTTPDDIFKAYDYLNASDPKTIDAKNAAGRFAHDYQIRQEAAQESATSFQQQQQQMAEATKPWADRNQSAAVASHQATPARLQTGDEIFQTTIDRLKSALPEFKDQPYPTRPPGTPEDWAHQGPGYGFGTPPPLRTFGTQSGPTSFPGVPNTGINNTQPSTTFPGVPNTGFGPPPAITPSAAAPATRTIDYTGPTQKTNFRSVGLQTDQGVGATPFGTIRGSIIQAGRRLGGAYY